MPTTTHANTPKKPALTPEELEDAFLAFAKVVTAELVRLDVSSKPHVFLALKAEAQNLQQTGSLRAAGILEALSRQVAQHEMAQLTKSAPDTGHRH